VREILILAVGGAAGAVSRYALSGWAHDLLGERFPYGTLAVNVLGCFCIGVAMQAGLSADLFSRSARLAITVGFLGAFTTFSTFGYETVRAIEDGAWNTAFTNVAANVMLGLFATWGGLQVARQIWGGA
jgi:CrcB protein